MISDNTSGPRAKRAAPISPAELQALAYWRLHNGRHWKLELLKAWGNHVYGDLPSDHGPLLHGLRNRLGPTWLARFSFNRDSGS